MGLEKRVFEKNNFIRPANRKTRMLFCQENRNWTKEDWKTLFSSDETMVVIKNACKIQKWGKSDHGILGTIPKLFSKIMLPGML